MSRYLHCCRGVCFLVFLIIIMVQLTGCTRSGPSRFYILTSMNGPGAEVASAQKSSLSVGVGPITLPDYLDRPQIVTRTGDNEIELAEFDKWAGSLKYDIPRVIAENLSVQLKTDQVYIFPWPGEVEPDYQATISIHRFDATPGQKADLIVLWSLYGKRGAKLLMTRKAAIRIPMQGTGYNEMVAAQSQALEELSQRISNHIH